MRFITYLATLLFAVFLSACGGGGGSAGLPSVTKTPITTSAADALTLAVGATQSFTITGGAAPYQISSSNVKVAVASLDGRNFSITGVAAGDAEITISDASQQSASIKATIANLAKFSTSAPLAINIAPKSTSLPYSITGGVQGVQYQWNSTDMRVATAQIDGNVLRINGLAVGVATIQLLDSATPEPTFIDIIVTVSGGTTEPLYTTAPSEISVAPQSLTTFPIGGGVPPYQVPSSTDSRIATASINAAGTTLSISSGTSFGTTNIIVFDSARNGFGIDVTVAGGTIEPLYTTVPDAGVTIGIGLTREFRIGGGVADYTVSSTEEGIATVSKDSSNKLYIRGVAAGKADITVRDRVGTTKIYPVTIGSSSAITHTAPTALTMVAETTQTFSISGGNPSYIASSNNITSVDAVAIGSQLTITAKSAGTATIKLVDMAGTEGPAITVTVTGSTTGTPVASSVEVISSKSSLLSAGAEAVITAFVKDSGNVGMANQVVTFTASSGVIQGTSAVTDASGVATAKLIPGSDKSNRAIVVRVVAGTATSGQVTVQVTGTSVTIAGASSLQVTTATKPVTAAYTLRALDSSSNPIDGATLTISSKLGNTLSQTSVTTDSTGTATVVYTPVNAGADILKVIGQGVTTEAAISVSAIDLSVLSPAPNKTISIGTEEVVTVQYLVNGVGQAGKSVSFSTTRGTIAAVLPNTLPAGQYSAKLSSTTAGLATVTAQIVGVGSVTLPVEFVATVPATVTLQANPGAIAPNTTGSTNQSTVAALIRDAAGNPVKDRQVNFTLITDLSNGTLSSGSAITNSNGQASVQFIAGSTSTPNNGVEIKAVDALTGLSNTAKLTVSGQSLFITIGFGNEIGNVDPTTYSRDFSVYVTDANGVAVGNQAVTLSVIPATYRKGYLVWGGTQWVSSDISTTCVNEDMLLKAGSTGYLNGVLNTGEDFNGDGRLTPGNIAVAAPGAVTTDVNGRAKFSVQYGEQFAPWATVEIEARAVVSGTESKRTISYSLDGSAPDFTKEDVAPAGVTSPFGTSEVLPRTSPPTFNGLCSNKN